MKTRILGIDPALRQTGWGIIEMEGNALRHVAHGVISIPSTSDLSTRLARLFEQMGDIIRTYAPTKAAVEETFVNQNPTSTLKLGMARGVALMCPAHYGLSVGEYGANKVKKSVCGAGHADKIQMIHMVNLLLPTARVTQADAADALAVAITHAHHCTHPHMKEAL